MTIAKILVPVRGDGWADCVLGHAAAVARVFNAHIEALHCRAKPENYVPYGVAVPSFLREQIAEQMTSVADSEEAAVRGVLEAFASRADIAAVTGGEVPPRDRASFSWREVQGRQAEILGVRGRLADLICVAKPDRESNLGYNTLYSALTRTGRPVLMCPPGEIREDLLEHMVIAWNGSTEAAHAVALGIDLVQRAARVTILTIGVAPEAARAGDLHAYLAVRGIAAETREIGDGGDIGRTLLAGAGELGATVLLMGAYSHSRERESLFGGASQTIVDRAMIPVVMAH